MTIALQLAREAAFSTPPKRPVDSRTPTRQYYYPSFVARLTLRFDEGLQVQAQPLPDPVSAADMMGEVSHGAGSARPRAEPARSVPLIVSGQEGDQQSFVCDVVPLSCDVSLEDPRQAGTFHMTIGYSSLPIDPRLLRTVGVEIHAGTVPAADFAAGVQGSLADGSRGASVSTRSLGISRDTLLFVGMADELEVEHGETASIITISGRDLCGVLLDAKIHPGMLAKIDLSRPIDDVVKQVLRMDPMGDKIAAAIVIQPDDWPMGKVPSPGAAGVLARLNMGAEGKKGGNSPTGDASQMGFWDVITHYCNLVGAIPYFDGAELRIRPGRALYDKRKSDGHPFDPINDLPFRNAAGEPCVRLGSNGKEFAVRRFAYGNNISKVSFKKKCAGVKCPTIQVVAVDESSGVRGSGQRLTAEWPPGTPEPKHHKGGHKASHKSARTTRVSTGGDTATDFLKIPVHGVISQVRLQELAKDYYEQIGRQEIGGSCEIRNLASLGGDDTDPDMMRMRPGDAVEFFTDTSGFGQRSPLTTELAQFDGGSFEQLAGVVTQSMQRHGWRVDQNLARAIVATAKGNVVNLLSYFHVTQIRYQWDGRSSRFSIEFSFDNFIMGRSDVTESTGATVSAPVRTTVGGGRHRVVAAKQKQQDDAIERRVARARQGVAPQVGGSNPVGRSGP